MSLLATTRRALLGLVGGLTIFRPDRTRAATGSFTLVPQLALGQRQRYRLELQQQRNGAIAHRSAWDVSLEVVTRMQEGWALCWTAENGQVLEADAPMRPMLEALCGLWDGVPIAFFVDAQGRVEGLTDPQDMQQRVAHSVERLLTQLAEDPGRAALRPHLQAALTPLLTHEALMTQMLLKEAMVLLGAMGRDYRVGEPLEMRSRIPSPLGSGEIPILGRFKVRAVDTARGEAELGWLMVVDRHVAARRVADELGGSLEALATAVAPGQEMDVAGTLDQALEGLDFEERADFHVDTATAWPRRVHHVRRTVAGPVQRVDSVELVRLGG